jgi:pimeloyl-ACP methyl ester carboxylesterase
MAKCELLMLALLFGSCPPVLRALELPSRADSVQIGDLHQGFRRMGQGPPLLLLHGLTNTWRVWRPYLSPLGAARELIVPDLRGHGETPNPALTLTAPQVAADMFALLDALKLDRIQIAGYSFGGHVALRMAAMHPERVDAMVVIAGAHRLIGSAKQYHEDAVRSEIPSDWWLTEVGTWHPGGERQVRRLLRQGCASALDDSFAMSESSLAAIRARVLVIQGDRDEVFPLEVPLDLYRKVKGSQLWIIPNADHNVVFWQDVVPKEVVYSGNPAANEIFAELVVAFLEQKMR